MLCIVVAVVLNAVIWFLGIDPSRTAIAEAMKQIEALHEKEAKLNQRLAVLEAIDTAALEQEQAEMLIQVPDVGLLREVMTELEIQAQAMEIDLSAMMFTPPGAQGAFQDMRITMQIQGGYHNLFNFINYLENNPRLMLVNNFNLSSSEEGLTSNLQMTVFSGDFDLYTPHQAPGRANPFREQ